MNKFLKDERGVSLIELIGVTVLLGVMSILISGIFFTTVKTTDIQGEKVQIQQAANNMFAQMESISKIKNIYKDAGYLGKFTGVDWHKAHIIKPLAEDAATGEWLAMKDEEQGTNKIAITNINDTLNKTKTTYQIKNPKIKIKILQQKNENEVTNTQYKTPNYRDTFSIQTTVMVLFYKDDINFSEYYEAESGTWEFDKLSKLTNTVYSRKSVMYYRDDDKAKGDVPGDGRW
ncbi:type II secretion system protein [Vagococcus coleopterorum]|uniref:Type II secretion system protein n=1 Tax=Vagococcus coleopterorum TaxID=2714946 RepID=A0A6G8AL64_9ENTE|nr:type II secretion system protein [Vagococcus coleopterorum]QIL45811.1 type II secretion system protein [Vagococcus coleopterorum]